MTQALQHRYRDSPLSSNGSDNIAGFTYSHSNGMIHYFRVVCGIGENLVETEFADGCVMHFGFIRWVVLGKTGIYTQYPVWVISGKRQYPLGITST